MTKLVSFYLDMKSQPTIDETTDKARLLIVKIDPAALGVGVPAELSKISGVGVSVVVLAVTGVGKSVLVELESVLFFT